MSQEEVIAFLSAPASYGSGVTDVERHETHGAIVFLAGKCAYKLKRAVRYPYMDFSTPDLRRAACEAELRVNRRTAPGLYLDVRPIVRDADGGLRFGDASGPSAVDWVVVMRRFPQEALLESIRLRDQLTPVTVRRLADAIADFHAKAEVTPQFGGGAGIARVIEENIEVLKSFAHTPFDLGRIQAYADASRHALEAIGALLEERRLSGFVRRCHGDLHLNNVCMIDDEPVLFDAIEFNEEFSCIDVFYDLAFLVMDLEHGEERGLANVLLNRYLERTDDFGALAVLPLFLCCRAAVRAHVKAAQASRSMGDVAHSALADATSYLEGAIAYLQPEQARLVVLGGLSGTGKSTVGRAVAPSLGRRPGAVVLRSDVLRKRLWGVEENARLPEAAYAASVTLEVYGTLADRARRVLAAGHSVIVDAVYGLPAERQSIAAVARGENVTLEAFWLEAPLAILEDRVAARRGDASDATIEVVRKQQGAVAIPPDWAKIDAGGAPDQTLRLLSRALGLQGKR